MYLHFIIDLAWKKLKVTVCRFGKPKKEARSGNFIFICEREMYKGGSSVYVNNISRLVSHLASTNPSSISTNKTPSIQDTMSKLHDDLSHYVNHFK